MKRFWAPTFGMLALLAGTSGALAQEAPTGTWLSEGGEIRVRIAKCASAYCGTIVWAKEEGKDENNPDPNLRSRSIVGVHLLTGLQPDGEGGWAGSLYNPENGKTYTSKVRLKTANALELSGCVLGGLICGTQMWSRVPEARTQARP